MAEYLDKEKPSCIISGMAIGWDMWGAWSALKHNIPLYAYVPFEGQENLWNEDYKDQYNNLLNKAKTVKYVCEAGYEAWKMIKRDEEMVKDADLVLALWNPDKQSGGTYKTIQMAKKKNIEVINFWEM